MVVESSNSVGNRSSLYTFNIRRRCKYFCLYMFVLMVLALTVIVGYLNCRLVTTTSRCELPLVAERTPLPICRGHSFTYQDNMYRRDRMMQIANATTLSNICHSTERYVITHPRPKTRTLPLPPGICSAQRRCFFLPRRPDHT